MVSDSVESPVVVVLVAEREMVRCKLYLLDTNNCYDNSSNYRFTPTTAGKYFVYSYVLMDTSAGNMRQISTRIYKNGNQGGGTFANINFDLVSAQDYQRVPNLGHWVN